MCGGTLSYPLGLPRRIGLSPRVRGNQSPFIFLCAGIGVYPRVCGGTHLVPSNLSILRGLSPRVRGNREIRPRPSSRKWVYPRVCGGTARYTLYAELTDGLSPRVRGNRYGPSGYCDGLGSIPACAGEPGHESGSPRLHQVYPRVCGGTSILLPLHVL